MDPKCPLIVVKLKKEMDDYLRFIFWQLENNFEWYDSKISNIIVITRIKLLFKLNCYVFIAPNIY